MSSKTSSHDDKRPKEIEREIDRLAQNDYLNGNDLLYFFCREYPIPPLEKVGEVQEQLTPAEAHFADQMWLIGRAYAASPERYSYSNKGKPKEDLLDEEGYESFFQDIARIILREECHQENEPVAYFRGNRININEMINYLDQKKALWTDIFDADGLDEWIQSSDKSKGSDRSMRTAAHNAARNLCHLLDNQGCFDKIRRESLGLMSARDTSDLESSFKNDYDLIRNSANCVVRFASILNSARKLRDISCVLKTLEEINTKARKLQEMPKSEDDLFKELFRRKWRSAKKSWEKLPERASLVVQEEPSDSISFSSKFLHFHYPEVFFIYDAISASKTRFSAEKNPELVDTFEGYKKYRTQKLRMMQELGIRPNNAESDYLDHAIEELIFSYFLFDHLLGNRDNRSCRKLLKRLDCSEPENQDDTYVPPHYTYIARLVDELVMNGDAERQN